MQAMVIKEFRELARDRRTVALLLAIPLLLLIVFGYAANFSVDETKVIVAGPASAQVERELAGNEAARGHIDIIGTRPELTDANIEDALRDGDADAVIMTTEPASGMPLATWTHLWVDGSQLFAAQSAQSQWLQVLAADVRDHVADLRGQLSEGGPAAMGALPNLSKLDLDALDRDTAVTVVYNPDLKTSWVMVPGLIGLILTFVGTVVTSIGLVRERETGTLEQLAVMPLRSAEIIAGKIAPYFLLCLIDAALITTVAVWLFNVPFTGAVWRFAALALVFVFVVLGLGVLISAISQNTGQAIQLAIMMVMPQVLLSGLIFPLESMAAGVRWIGYILPLTWFNMASNGIMLKDTTFSGLALPMGILVLQAVVIFGLASIRMGRLLSHGGATK